MPKITPCLWIEKNVLEAVNFYLSIFPNSKITYNDTVHNSGPNSDMDVTIVNFNLSGQDFMAFNGGAEFKFNESISFAIDCDGQEEVDYYWQKLIADGGQESQCGWLKDKFGVSWQVIPTQLNELLSDPDPVKANKVMQAMLKMQKIVISDLEKARDN